MQQNVNCYVCGKRITMKNKSEEHIILNAVGGKLKSKELICKECNSKIGNQIDSELAKQLNFFANLLNIKRDRGIPQDVVGVVKKTGEKYSIKPGGKPSLNKPSIIKTSTETGEYIDITARNETELKSMLKGLKNKYPNFDTDKALISKRKEEFRLKEPISVQQKIGGELVFRAICKAAINFYIHVGGKRECISHLIPYITGNEPKSIVWFCYEEDIYSLDKEECNHIIHLIGNPEEQILYCYIDYFNAHKYIVLLNDNYSGDIINKSYCYDLINQKEVNKKININYSRSEICNIVSSKLFNYSMITESHNQFMEKFMKKNQTDIIRDATEKAMNNSLLKYPDNIPITKEMMDEFIKEAVNNLMPYLKQPLDDNDKYQ